MSALTVTANLKTEQALDVTSNPIWSIAGDFTISWHSGTVRER
jgi:hypothetical protein